MADKHYPTAFARARDEVDSFSHDTKSVAMTSMSHSATPNTMVKSFHLIYGIPAPKQHTPMSVGTRDRRLRLILEEFLELVAASGFRLSARDYAGEVVTHPGEQDIRVDHIEGSQQDPVEIMDALADIIYVTYGFAIELGLDLDEVLREVHAANLTKLGADGKPIVNGVTPGYRPRNGTSAGVPLQDEEGFNPALPVGKIIKGPNYMPPQIAILLRHKLAKSE